MPEIKALVEAASASKLPAKVAEKVKPEEFRERIAESVERRGQLKVARGSASPLGRPGR
jgi:hypothetical protein